MAGRPAIAVFLTVLIWASAGSTAAAAPPDITATWASGVTESSAQIDATVDPGGIATKYHFEYIPDAAYQANLANNLDGFSGATATVEAIVGLTPRDVERDIVGLPAEAAYRYRAVAKNAAGTALGVARRFTTLGFGAALTLPDGRGWEMVSPVDKNGGEIQGFGGNAGGGVLQAAAAGGVVTFSSASSFGGGQGAPVASQYIARRASGGWANENITTPLSSGGYGEAPAGVPYRLFSTDLLRSLLLGVPYPPLAGTGAPAGYPNYYLRDSASGRFEALLTAADVAGLALPPRSLELAFAGASPDLGHVVVSTCAALTDDATEVPDGVGGCDPGSPNLYEWAAGGGLELVNPVPGAWLAAPAGAISADGSRVYWTDGEDLYLRQDGAPPVQIDAAAGGGGSFQTASGDGSVALFTKGQQLFRYDAGNEALTPLTPAGTVLGVLGAAADGSHVYYLGAAGVFLNRAGADTPVALGADLTNVPPSTGTARVSPDGSHLAFLSSAELTDYDNANLNTKEPDSEVYLYDAGADKLVCASCNPSGTRPLGPSTIPGAVANGKGAAATVSYKPRVLSSDGRRLFFDSYDTLVLQDKNTSPDVYEWEAQGAGGCQKSEGCVQLISNGAGAKAAGATFVDASADGSDVFFLTDFSLVPSDPGAVDLYDARVGGGFPLPPTPIPCEGDSCQGLPALPDDPRPGTVVATAGNPPVSFRKPGKKKKRHRAHRRRMGQRR